MTDTQNNKFSTEEMQEILKNTIPDMEIINDPWEEDKKLKTIYLGSYMSLDPCGKYHHWLSPNGMTEECEKYWDNLNHAAENLGGWIESGEGDPTDIFFNMPYEV